MKTILTLIIILIYSISAMAQWEFAGPPSLILPGSQEARMDTSNGKIFVASEISGNNEDIKYLEGNSWIDTFPDLNAGMHLVDFAMFDSFPYLLLTNNDSLYLFNYDGTSWKTLGNQAIMKFTLGQFQNSALIRKFNNSIYVSGNHADTAVVKRFDGNSWFQLINTQMQDSWQAGSCLVYYNNMLYLSGRSNNETKIIRHNGTSWEDVTPPYPLGSGNYWVNLFVDTLTNKLMLNIDSRFFYSYDGTSWSQHSTLTKCNVNWNRRSSLSTFHNRLALIDYDLHALSIFESGEWWTIPSYYYISNNSKSESIIKNDSLFVIYYDESSIGYYLKKFNPSPIQFEDSIFNANGCNEDTITYSVHVNSTPLALHWYQNNTLLNSELCVDTIYSIALFNSNQNGEYKCIVTNGIDFDTTSTGNILVIIPPSEATQQSSIQKCLGESFQINTSINGTPPFTYQWYKGSSSISNADSNIYFVSTSLSSDQGNYHCVVTNLCGSTNTANVPVTIYNLNSTVSGESLICGGSAQISNFNTNYNGSGTLNYSWNPSIGLNDSTISNPIITITSDQEYVLHISASTSNQCETYDTVHISVLPLTITCTDLTLTCGDTLPFQISTNYTGIDPLIFLWSTSTGINDSTIANPNCHLVGNGIYHVQISTLNNCQASDSLIVTSAVTNINYPICIVGVASNNNNIIIWEKELTTVIDSFLVFRESSLQTGVYNQIGSLAYSDSTYFIDSTANSKVQSYKYKIANKDICGNITTLSEAHKTMHLNINQGMGTTWNLIWEEYEGFTVSSYKIYRGSHPDSLVLIGSTAGGNTSYSDFNSPQGYVYYQIEIISPNTCYPTKNFNISRSNIATNNPYWINELTNSYQKLDIFPNPTTDICIIKWRNPLHQNYKLKITDISGKLIQVNDNISTGSFVINASSFESGVYFVEIRGIDVYRGQLIIK